MYIDWGSQKRERGGGEGEGGTHVPSLVMASMSAKLVLAGTIDVSNFCILI